MNTNELEVKAIQMNYFSELIDMLKKSESMTIGFVFSRTKGDAVEYGFAPNVVLHLPLTQAVMDALKTNECEYLITAMRNIVESYDRNEVHYEPGGTTHIKGFDHTIDN